MTERDDKHRIEELRRKVEKTPGAPDFAELARYLLESESTRAEAREICFRGLKADPHNAPGRLALAQSFYLDGLGEFCVRELVELKKYSSAPSIDRLLQAFGDFARPFLPRAVGKNTAAAGLLPPADEEPAAEKQTAPHKSSESVVAEIDLDFEETLDELKDD